MGGDSADRRLAPASFAPEEGEEKKKEKKPKSVFNFCKESNGTRNCIVNSVAAEANRMERLFKEEPYSALMPHIFVTWDEERVDLLDAPHRVADALPRYTSLAEEIKSAIVAFRRGDAEPLAKISPSSIVFGFWDSRDSHLKWARAIASDIFAYNVSPWDAAGSYNPCMDYKPKLEKAGLESKNNEVLSDLGVNQCVFHTSDRGGVVVRGDIIRKSVISLTHIRNIPCPDPERAKKLRRYCLGIALVSLTNETDYAIRSGCELIWDRTKAENGKIVLQRMETDEPFELTHEESLEFALAAAKDFGVSAQTRDVTFDTEALRKKMEEKKKKPESTEEESEDGVTEEVHAKPRRRHVEVK
jgi:CRISPR-associated protein Csb1